MECIYLKRCWLESCATLGKARVPLCRVDPTVAKLSAPAQYAVFSAVVSMRRVPVYRIGPKAVMPQKPSKRPIAALHEKVVVVPSRQPSTLCIDYLSAALPTHVAYRPVYVATFLPTWLLTYGPTDPQTYKTYLHTPESHLRHYMLQNGIEITRFAAYTGCKPPGTQTARRKAVMESLRCISICPKNVRARIV